MNQDAGQDELQGLISQLADEVMVEAARGETADIEAMAKRHPNYATEIPGNVTVALFPGATRRSVP